jgi:hypothetical protein
MPRCVKAIVVWSCQPVVAFLYLLDCNHCTVGKDAKEGRKERSSRSSRNKGEPRDPTVAGGSGKEKSRGKGSRSGKKGLGRGGIAATEGGEVRPNFGALRWYPFLVQ